MVIRHYYTLQTVYLSLSWPFERAPNQMSFRL